MEHIIGWIVVGLILGVATQIYVRGKYGVLAIASSIAGCVSGGLVMKAVCGPSPQFDMAGTYSWLTACPSWFMAFLCSAVAIGFTYALTEDWRERDPDLL